MKRHFRFRAPPFFFFFFLPPEAAAEQSGEVQKVSENAAETLIAFPGPFALFTVCS